MGNASPSSIDAALGNTQVDVKSGVMSTFNDTPSFLPVHKEVLQLLVGQSFVDDGSDGATLWESIDNLIAQREILLQAQRESTMASRIHKRAICLQAPELFETKKRSNDELGAFNDTKEAAKIAVKPDPAPRSSPRKRKSRRTSYESHLDGDPDDIDEITSPYQHMHVVARLLGRRCEEASDKFGHQAAPYDRTRTLVNDRIKILTTRLDEVRDKLNEDKQQFIRKVLSLDLYKVRHAATPIGGQETESRSNMERLQTELRLWTMLHDDMERVFGAANSK